MYINNPPQPPGEKVKGHQLRDSFRTGSRRKMGHIQLIFSRGGLLETQKSIKTIYQSQFI